MSKANGNGHDPEWDNLGDNVRSYVNQYRKPGEPLEEDTSPPQDPRDNTDFCAVWDAVALASDTSHIVAYINGATIDPIPTLRDIVTAFYRAGRSRAIVPEQISTVIAICGGQMSRHINLRNDIVAEWNKLRSDDLFEAAQKQQARDEAGVPWAQSVGAFIRSQRLPEYLIEPMIQRASLYTVTALTSHGKTAVLLYIALCVASGRAVAGKPTVKGRVVWFAGENPSDFAQKLVTACHHWGFDPDALDMVVLPGAFDLASMPQEAVKMAAGGGETALVVIDTSAAYRFDDDEDSNANSITWARMLRQHFPTMPGRPAVLLATHPTKHADPDNLLPRGGGSFLNEVDGNLTLWADEDQAFTRLHWQGKLRGMSFPPIAFELRSCPHPTWTLRNGEPVTIKLAMPASSPHNGAATPHEHTHVPRSRGRQFSDKADLAASILGNLLFEEGKPGYGPNGLPAVPKDRWRTEFYARACIAEDKPDSRLKAFQRAVDRLITRQKVAANGPWVWLTQQPEVV